MFYFTYTRKNKENRVALGSMWLDQKVPKYPQFFRISEFPDRKISNEIQLCIIRDSEVLKDYFVYLNSNKYIFVRITFESNFKFILITINYKSVNEICFIVNNFLSIFYTI